MSADPALAPFIDVLPSAIFYPSDQAAWPAVQGAIQQTLGTALAGTDKQQVLDQIQADGHRVAGRPARIRPRATGPRPERRGPVPRNTEHRS